MSSIDWSNANNKTKIFSFEGRECLGKVVYVYDGDTVKIVFQNFLDIKYGILVMIKSYSSNKIRKTQNEHLNSQ